MGLSQHPVPSRQVPGWPSTSFDVVLNDTAHIERCHDVFVPYCTVIVNATLTDIGKIHRPRQFWVTKGTVGVFFTATEAHPVTNNSQVWFHT